LSPRLIFPPYAAFHPRIAPLLFYILLSCLFFHPCSVEGPFLVFSSWARRLLVFFLAPGTPDVPRPSFTSDFSLTELGVFFSVDSVFWGFRGGSCCLPSLIVAHPDLQSPSRSLPFASNCCGASSFSVFPPRRPVNDGVQTHFCFRDFFGFCCPCSAFAFLPRERCVGVGFCVTRFLGFFSRACLSSNLSREIDLFSQRPLTL